MTSRHRWPSGCRTPPACLALIRHLRCRPRSFTKRPDQSSTTAQGCRERETLAQRRRLGGSRRGLAGAGASNESSESRPRRRCQAARRETLPARKRGNPAIGGRAADRRVLASLLVGDPGFVRVLDERTVRIDAAPLPGDPFEKILQVAGAKVGVLALDLPSRRRLHLSSEAERRPTASTFTAARSTPTAPNTSRSVCRGPAEVGG
jgi:hypothetical protein